MEYKKDYLASRVISFGKELDDYSKIYFSSNEDLVSMYRDIDFLDKEVLSVMASSDQIFTSNYLGARNTDSFDKNVLALYYYYLRRWTVNISHEVYPFKLLDNDYNWLRNLLSKVKPSTDNETYALLFWTRHLENETDFEGLFYKDDREGKVIYKTVNPLLEVVDRELNFKTLNMFNRVELPKKYDIIISSNILEWARGDSKKIITVRDNFNRILNSNGIVLCSSLIDRPKEKQDEERIIFSKYFDREDHGKSGYVYRKK